MFDISFTELMIIGAVALVVIGPERLPRVARTAGHLLGRFQRYVAQVKSDISREMELAELKKLQTSVQDAARDLEQTVKSEMNSAEQELRSAETELRKAEEEIRRSAEIAPPAIHMGMGPQLSTGEPAAADQAAPGALSPAANPSEALPSTPAEPDEPRPQLELGLDNHGRHAQTGIGGRAALSPFSKPQVSTAVSDLQQEGESFLSHLVELRNRLVRAFLAIIAVTVCLLPFSSRLYDFLASPMMHALPEGTRMIATEVVTPFLVPVKVVLLVALVLTLPYLLYQAWAFIAPGLYQHEKRLVLPLVVASTFLFLVGMAFCYFFVFGVVFKFVYSIAPKSISVAPDIENYFNFAIGMFLAFGVTFEVPIVVIVLAKMGIVSVAKLREIRPYVIVGSFVVAAVVTPPDAVSQLLLAIPLCVLYEIGILVAAMITPRPEADSEYQKE